MGTFEGQNTSAQSRLRGAVEPLASRTGSRPELNRKGERFDTFAGKYFLVGGLAVPMKRAYRSASATPDIGRVVTDRALAWRRKIMRRPKVDIWTMHVDGTPLSASRRAKAQAYAVTKFDMAPD